jgi:rhamnulokinase
VTTVAAVDCGATSVRTCRVDLDASPLVAEVVHRVPHGPVRDDRGHQRWDWSSILSAVEGGLELCLERGPLDSIGVDTWGVDYGLLDDSGRLLSAPFSYRDHRTDDYREVAEAFGIDAMYRVNGLQLQPFNTIFQLARHDRRELTRAARLLWLPEVIVHALTGTAVTERTSAGSSGLVDVSTGDWSRELIEVAGIDRALLGEIEQAGRVVGEWRGVPVTLVAGHDTASAVAGMGTTLPGSSAFVATGTWILAGIERPRPDISRWAQERGFTNEAGALGGFRFLRNVTGFWLLEQCRRSWPESTVEALLAAADSVGAGVPVVDVDADELRAPADMLAAYTSLAELARDSAPALVTRSIVESIARRTAEVVHHLAERHELRDLVLFGGAARPGLFARRLAELTGLPIRLGSSEATALGNAIVQGLGIGALSTLEEGRARISTTPLATAVEHQTS